MTQGEKGVQNSWRELCRASFFLAGSCSHGSLPDRKELSAGRDFPGRAESVSIGLEL